MQYLGSWRTRKNVVLAGAVSLLLLALGSISPVQASIPATDQSAISALSAPDDRARVIVVTEARVDRGVAERQAGNHGGEVDHVYRSALAGYSASVPTARLAALRRAPNVRSVELDQQAHAFATQNPVPSWGLDRADQRDLPLSGNYTYDTTGSGVQSYILDSGIRLTHSDWSGRIRTAPDFVDHDSSSDDCHGHGSHVAGTTAGASYGIAKGATLVAVRVLDCDGVGNYSDMIAAIDWINADHSGSNPAVVNASLGGPYSDALDTAVTNSVQDGISWVVAAGNSNANACDYSPASTPGALTVAASNGSDERASFSNFGSCVDLFAPGVNITSAGHLSDTDEVASSGTSMAAPHVAGAVARYLGTDPSASPATVSAFIVNQATPNKVIDAQSPNRLLHVGAPTVTPPPPSPCTVTGTAGNDYLVGTAGADVICGKGGSDTLKGRGGADKLVGGNGGDKLYGGRGHDDILGGGGSDNLYGQAGTDRCEGGAGTDTAATCETKVSIP